MLYVETGERLKSFEASRKCLQIEFFNLSWFFFVVFNICAVSTLLFHTSICNNSNAIVQHSFFRFDPCCTSFRRSVFAGIAKRCLDCQFE
jgi:hypothetical protein